MYVIPHTRTRMKLYHGVRKISRAERELLELKRQESARTTTTLVLSRFYYRQTRVAKELPIYTTQPSQQARYAITKSLSQ